MSRTEFSRATRQAALRRAGLRCEASGPRYGLKEGQRCNCSLSLGVQFDHDVPDQLGGDNSLENCRAVCVQCHRIKTRGDIRQIRKSDRQRDKHSGTMAKKGKPMPGSKSSEWKRRMDGRWEHRTTGEIR